MPWGGGGCGMGGPEHPLVGMDPPGSRGQGTQQHLGHGGLCNPLVPWVSLCNSCLFPRPVSMLCPFAKSPPGAGTRLHAPTSASSSVLAASAGVFRVFSSPLAHVASSCLPYCLSVAMWGQSFPSIAPGLPLIIQARRMRPSSSSVCVSSRLLGLNCVSSLARCLSLCLI